MSFIICWLFVLCCFVEGIPTKPPDGDACVTSCVTPCVGPCVTPCVTPCMCVFAGCSGHCKAPSGEWCAGPGHQHGRRHAGRGGGYGSVLEAHRLRARNLTGQLTVMWPAQVAGDAIFTYCHSLYYVDASAVWHTILQCLWLLAWQMKQVLVKDGYIHVAMQWTWHWIHTYMMSCDHMTCDHHMTLCDLHRFPCVLIRPTLPSLRQGSSAHKASALSIPSASRRERLTSLKRLGQYDALALLSLSWHLMK